MEKEYRCQKCKNLLFKGSIIESSYISIMCNKSIKNKNKKYKKCKNINNFGGKNVWNF